MTSRPDLNAFSADQLRALATELFDGMERKDRVLAQKDRTLSQQEKVIRHRDAVIEKQAHELALLKRHKFARRSEQFKGVQGQLLEELVDADLAAMEAELSELLPAEAPTTAPKQKAKRAPLPPQLPRTLIHHEPENTQCRCGCQLKRIGEDISEKLDYVPGEFTVERHIRGKWAVSYTHLTLPTIYSV